MLRRTGLATMGVMAMLTACIGAGEKEVPYIATPQVVVDAMLEMAQVGQAETVYDLGCGDGRIVISAARDRGARGIGVDIDPERIAESKENARKAGVSDRVEFIQKDLHEMDYLRADVVMLYLLPTVNMKLRPTLLKELRPGARVVSHAFDMGDWKPDAHRKVSGSDIYLWIIPASASGQWRTQVLENGSLLDATLELTQKHQEVSGVARVGKREMPLREPTLTGTLVTFKLDDGAGGVAQYTGRILGDRIEGTLSAAQGKPRQWTASRP